MSLNDIKFQIQAIMDDPDALKCPEEFQKKMLSLGTDIVMARHGVNTPEKLREYNNSIADIQAIMTDRIVSSSKRLGVSSEDLVKFMDDPNNLPNDAKKVMQVIEGSTIKTHATKDKALTSKEVVKSHKRIKTRSKRSWTSV